MAADTLQTEALQLTLALDAIRDSIDEDDDPQRMFDDIVRLLHRQFRADGCAVVLLQETSDDIEAIATSGLEQGEAIDLCREAMRRSAPDLIENPYWEHALGNGIVLKELPLGGLVLTRRDSPFTDHERELLGIAEKQIDSAIIQARTNWKLIQRNRELSAIYQIDRLRDQITDADALIDAFTDVLVEQFSASLAMIVLHEGRAAVVRKIVDQHNLAPEAVESIRTSITDLTIPQIIPTPAGVSGLILLAAPFILGEQRIGALVVGRNALFTIADHRLLYAITSQMDTALATMNLQAAIVQLGRSRDDESAQSSSANTVLNDSIRYVDGQLYCDSVPVAKIVAQTGTPAYIYSLRRALANFSAIQSAFPDAHIHFSAKSNSNLDVLRALVEQGAGIDTVSGGEIHRALLAGADPQKIVFAGVGKTSNELYFAVDQNVGWVNIENVEEAHLLNAIATTAGKCIRVALRFNPNVAANTHPHIATGHGGAKFGMSADAIRALLDNRDQTPSLSYEGIHIHIGSQLHDTEATAEALRVTRELIAPYPFITTIDIGGGLPSRYQSGEALPSPADFAAALKPLLEGYNVILEPGRSVIADAGLLVARVLYVKEQGGHTFLIADTGMTELIRPALYNAHHEIVPLSLPQTGTETITATVVGPICETTDVLARNVVLPPVQPGDLLAILSAGAYGMVMASSYNSRPRPPEIVVDEDGSKWHVSRRRESWQDLVQYEMPSKPSS
jgi:diaminopimelate decarboxylase